MHDECTVRNFPDRRRQRITGIALLAPAAAVAMVSPARAQSTFGSILGTVKDPSGAVIADCVVLVTNTGTSARRSVVTDKNASYEVPNLDPSTYTVTTYTVTMEAKGFRTSKCELLLGARATVRIDGQVSVASQTESVTVNYQLAFGRQGLFLKGANSIADRIVGGWELAGVPTFQSGPWLTIPGADPSGTGFPQITGNGRADVVSGVSLCPASQTIQQWLNPAAFAVPANNMGRFGDSSVGLATGPGTQAVNISLMRSVAIWETAGFQVGAQVANLFNHPNYLPPSTTFGTPAFGTISNVQSAEGGGPRAVQIAGRFTF